jgi:DNA-directed RNA polymerase, mitochondrial
MVCPPQPYWTSTNGGYLIARSELLRVANNSYQQIGIVNSTPVQTLYPVLDALNQQQNIAWRVNTEILDVVLEVFRKGGNNKLDVPEQPSNLDPPELSDKSNF